MRWLFYAVLLKRFCIILLLLMKKILLLLSLLPLLATAQNMPATTPSTAASKEKLLEGFTQVGYVHELWIVSNNLSYGYSSLSYTGNGFYVGGGLRSRMNNKRPFGFGLSLDYLQYNMDKTLNTNEGVPVDYSFLRATSMIFYRFNSKSKFTFTARGDVGCMVATTNNAHNYLQLGLKGCVGYGAYEANIGFNFSQADDAPATDLNSKWREQMFALGVTCYPGRIPGFLPHRAPKPAATK